MKTRFDSIKAPHGGLQGIHAKVNKKQAGFTLLEVVITLIVASILGVILLEFMGTTVQESYKPIYMAQDSMNVNQIMEKMNADYKKLLLESIDPLEDFRLHVMNGNDDSNSPYFGYYSADPPPIWIKFVDGEEEPDDTGANRILKVKVTHNNRSVTSLFVK